MGQQMVKYNIGKGSELYSRQKPDEAIMKWRWALNRIHNVSEKFSTLNYLINASFQLNDPIELLNYAKQQHDLATSLNCSIKHAHAKFHLAMAHYCLGDNKSCLEDIDNVLRSVEYIDGDVKLITDCHLYAARACVSLCKFYECFNYLIGIQELQTKKANYQFYRFETELQIHIIVGDLFSELRDYKSAEIQYEMARNLSDSFDMQTCKYQRETAIRVAEVNCKLEKLTESKTLAEDALRASIDEGDIQMEVRCLICLADIKRRQGFFKNALNDYETAEEKLLQKIVIRRNDVSKNRFFHRLEVAILLGKTATIMTMHKYDNEICECKALQLNKITLSRALKSSEELTILRCNSLMEKLYRSLNDWQAAQKCSSTIQDLLRNNRNLQCSICRNPLSIIKNTRLKILLCRHIAHSTCGLNMPGLQVVCKRPVSINLSPKCKFCLRDKKKQDG